MHELLLVHTDCCRIQYYITFLCKQKTFERSTNAAAAASDDDNDELIIYSVHTISYTTL